MELCFDHLVMRSPAHGADGDRNISHEVCYGLPFQLHGDGRDGFSARKTQDNLAGDDIEVGVPRPLVVQHNSHGHGCHF